MKSSVDAALKKYPDAAIDQDNVALYEGWLEHELRLPKCRDCGLWHQPSRSICPHCLSFNLDQVPVSGRGTIHIATLLRQGPPTPGVEYPYPVVTVELEEQEGLRYTSTLLGVEGPDSIRIGRPVELAWIERNGAPFPAFQPVAGSASGKGGK